MTEQLQFRFKGDRTYVHGTDVFNALLNSNIVRNLAPVQSIDLVFRRTITTSLQLTPVTKLSGSELVRCVFETTDGQSLCECTAGSTEVNGRYPYDESDVLRGAAISQSQREASLTLSTEYTFIEQLVALNKALVQDCVPLPDDRKWLFARLVFSGPIPDSGWLSLKCDSASNLRITESVITLDESIRGKIYFTALKT